MKPFKIEPGMKTLRGVFYPTGWMVLMFAGEQQARAAVKKLVAGGIGEDSIMLMTPQDFRREIAGSEGEEEILPSAGTEADTVRRFAELVAQGHHGLMVHAPSHHDSERVTELLRDAGMAYGQKYRTLVIEDVE